MVQTKGTRNQRTLRRNPFTILERNRSLFERMLGSKNDVFVMILVETSVLKGGGVEFTLKHRKGREMEGG